MSLAGRIALEGEFEQWRPEGGLATADPLEVRFSRGFLRASSEKLFPGLASMWLPFFHTLGVEVTSVECSTSLVFPDDVSRVIPIEVDGEPGVIGMDEVSQQTIVNCIAADSPALSSDLVLEYVERRFLSVLGMTFASETPLHCFYGSASEQQSVDVIGTFNISCNLAGMPCRFHVGIGRQALERVDQAWKERLELPDQGLLSSLDGDAGEECSIEIATLAVPPAVLIDYMKSGTILDLEIPSSEEVFIRIGDKLWAKGQLLQVEGKFAVRVTDVLPDDPVWPEATTRVHIELARFTLDAQTICELSQEGAIFTSDFELSNSASMVISRERVASASVGTLDNHFALNVLPK